MILVAGGTGHLGADLVPRLTARGVRVRILTRDPLLARQRLGAAPELAMGDARNPDSLAPALDGTDAVVSALTGFGPGGHGPRAVDYEGNLNLIRAAAAAGTRRFVMVSMHGASAEHPMELMRMKHRAEQAVRASRLDWSIVRPTAFMELWTRIVGNPIIKSGTTLVFGRGNNPVNFISARDVAGFVELALFDRRLRREVLDVGGPENPTFNQLIRQIELAAGRKARVRHVPVPVMRLAYSLLQPVKPDIARMIQAGIVLDSIDMSFDAAELRRRFPHHRLTSVAEVLHWQFGARPPGFKESVDGPAGTANA